MSKSAINIDVHLNFDPVIEELKDTLRAIKRIERKMTYNEYKKGLEITKQFLDLIDVEIYLKPKKDINDIMDSIEDDNYLFYYNPEAKEFFDQHNDVFQNYIFNVMDHDEFLDYCKNRYPQYIWRNEIIERNYIYGVKNE